MARISYDVYSPYSDAMVVITNADNDDSMDITSESLSNPPIKMRVLDAKREDGDNYEYSDFFRVSMEHRNDETFTTRLPQLLNGEIPNWRLIGVNFAIDGPDLLYVNSDTDVSSVDSEMVRDGYEYENIICLGFDYLILEFTIDYADGFPPRRYLADLRYVPVDGYEEDLPVRGFKAKITEYCGKRKIRKIEFSEYDDAPDSIYRHPCHITEY